MFGKVTPKRRPMDDQKLMAAIREFEAESYGFASGQLAEERSYAIERYLALPYGDEVDGRSQVVDTGFRDTIEWLLPQILRVFLAGNQVVKLDPTGPQDEPQCEQETDYVNHVILEKNDAFNIFSTWFRDALMSKVGYVKAFWKERHDVLSEDYKGITDDQLMLITNDPQVSIITGQSYPDPMWAPMPNPPPQPGQPAPQQQPVPMLHDVKLRRVKVQGFCAVDNVPPEEIYVHRSLRTIAMEDCQFVQHRARRTLSQLRQDGYDIPDDVSTTGDDAGQVNDQITISRDRFDDDEDLREDLKSVDPANRRVWFRESYLRVDYDGDGVAELRKVCHLGNEIVSNEECEIIPFAAVTPIVFPHRHIGIGYDDLTDQPSRVATALARSFLDNEYLKNNGRYGIDVDNVNVDDMLVSRPGGLVRTKGDPNASIMPLTHPSSGQDALSAMQWVQTWREMSTGVRADQSNMSPDVLNNTTATATAAMVSAGQSRVEAVTRSFATGVKELFGIVHAITLKNATSDEKLKLNNKWVTVDPREWVKRSSMTITVGLGTGTKESRLALLKELLMGLQAAMQIGVANPQNIYHVMKLVTEEMGYKNPDDFLTDPSKSPPPPPHQDPHVQAAQAKGQVDLQIAQQKMQSEQAMSQQKTQSDAAIEQLKMQKEQAVEAARAQASTQIENNKAQMTYQLELAKAKMSLEIQDVQHQRDAQNEIQLANIKVMGQIEVARIAAASSDGQAAMKATAEAAGDPAAADPVKEVREQLQQHIQATTASMNELHKAVTAPKRIVRGPDGRAIGLETAQSLGAN